MRGRGGRPRTDHVNRAQRYIITPYRASPLEGRSGAMRGMRRVAPDAPRQNQRDGLQAETERSEGGEKGRKRRGGGGGGGAGGAA